MKKIISILLSAILMLFLSVPVFAKESSDLITDSSLGKKLFQYMQGDDGKLLILKKNYGYMTFIEGFKSDAWVLYLLEMADKLIDTGATPDKEKYMETLVNIIATYDLDRADDVAKQKKMDNLKTFQDYAMDCAEMGNNAVSVMVGNNPAASELETTLSIAIDSLGLLIDNTDNWISALSNLETIIQDYSEHDEFLKLIEEKSDGELKLAAQTLRRGMKKALEIKLDTYQDVSDMNYKNYEEFFFSNVFFDAVRQMPDYKEDEALKYFVDAGDDIVSKENTLGSAWDLGTMIGTLVGDVVVGGENLINRVLEMMAIYDISEVLQGKIIETGTDFLNSMGKDNEESLAHTYIAFSNYLIGCRIRGEYCMYSIVAEDAGLLSWFNKNSAEEARSWYDDKAKKILAIQNNLLQVYEQENMSYDRDIMSDDWKQMYIDCIQNSKEEGWAGYNLIYIDDDNIPELYMNGSTIAQGDRVYFMEEGELHFKYGYVCGITYIERENLFCDSGGHMDVYHDYVYQFENGKVLDWHRGEYGAENNANVQYDVNGYPIYDYWWDGEEVLEREYQDNLNKVYDLSRVTNAYEELYNADEIIEKIRNL